jgi:hypothetical protein
MPTSDIVDVSGTMPVVAGVEGFFTSRSPKI